MGQYNKILTIRVFNRFYEALYNIVKKDNTTYIVDNIPHTTAGVIRCLIMDYVDMSQYERRRLLKKWNGRHDRRHELFSGKYNKE